MAVILIYLPDYSREGVASMNGDDSDDDAALDPVWDLASDELKPKSLGAEIMNFFDDLRRDGPGGTAGGAGTSTGGSLKRSSSMRKSLAAKSARLSATLARRLGGGGSYGRHSAGTA